MQRGESHYGTSQSDGGADVWSAAAEHQERLVLAPASLCGFG